MKAYQKLPMSRLASFSMCLCYSFIGTCVVFSVFVYVIIISPIFIYRQIVTKGFASFHSNVGKAVTVSAQFMAAEFLQSKCYPDRPSRCAIICRSVVQGIVTYEEISQAITTGWLTPSPEDSKLNYPEFQQYIESWMGFMFWKKDTSFDLSNHLSVHCINGDLEVESDAFMEETMNSPFPVKRSPWSLYLLQSKLFNATICIFKFHHAMVDGFSIMHAIGEGLGKRKLEEYHLPKPTSRAKAMKGNSLLESVLFPVVYKPLRLLYDAGYLTVLEYQCSKSKFSWYSNDKTKSWRQLYAKSSLIPVEKIKGIKNHLGGTFTGVLLSSISTAVSKTSSALEMGNKSNSIPIYTVVPVECHPNKLRNNVMGTILELDVSPNLDSTPRHQLMERRFKDARYMSQVPCLMSMFGSLFSFPLAWMSRQLCKNNMFSVLLTNFPGPPDTVQFQGKECISLDFGVGGEEGVCGVTFSVVSYNGNVRITVNAEESIITKLQLLELVKSIETEIDTFHESLEGISKESSSVHNTVVYIDE